MFVDGFYTILDGSYIDGCSTLAEFLDTSEVDQGTADDGCEEAAPSGASYLTYANGGGIAVLRCA